MQLRSKHSICPATALEGEVFAGKRGRRQLEVGTAASGAVADGNVEFGLLRSDTAQVSQRELSAPLCYCRDCFSWNGGVLALLFNLHCFSLSLLPE